MRPFAYPPQIRAAILARVAAGERVKHMAREAGMPCAESVNGWMRADPGFAAEMAQARRVGEHRRRFVCDEVKARAILGRLAAGETLSAVLRDPEMPSYRTFVHWRATQGWFAEEVWRLNRQKAANKAQRLRDRRRAYDPEVGERLYVRLWKGERLRAILSSDKAFPSLSVLARWRRDEPAFDAMLRFAMGAWKHERPRRNDRLYSPERVGEVFAGIVAGGSLRSLARRPDMPCARTLYAWCRTRPEFAAMVAEACTFREDWYLEQLVRIAEAATPGTVGRARRAMAPLNAQLVRLKKRPGWKSRSLAAPG